MPEVSPVYPTTHADGQHIFTRFPPNPCTYITGTEVETAVIITLRGLWRNTHTHTKTRLTEL